MVNRSLLAMAEANSVAAAADNSATGEVLAGGRKPTAVIVAVDGSRTAEHAFDWYLQYIHSPENEVVVVHSVELTNVHAYPSVFVRPEILEAEFSKEKDKAKGLEKAVKRKLREHKVRGRFTMVAGIAGEVIVDLAKRESAELIVVGTRGWGKIRRTILGSVSDYVIHHAHCGVLTIRKSTPL